MIETNQEFYTLRVKKPKRNHTIHLREAGQKRKTEEKPHHTGTGCIQKKLQETEYHVHVTSKAPTSISGKNFYVASIITLALKPQDIRENLNTRMLVINPNLTNTTMQCSDR